MAAVSAEKDEDVEIFQDAADSYQPPDIMDLKTALEECHLALNLFLSNRFDEAKKIVQPWSDRSMYHSLGYSTIMFLQAAMTFEEEDISNAAKVCKIAVDVCHKSRKKTSLFSFKSVDYNSYTLEELHAELCYAECLLERALLNFIEDENLISFIKGGLKIKAGYSAYKECDRMLSKRCWENDDEVDNFKSGVLMGNGMFNLMISQLPSRILKILEFVGFSGDKARGLHDLEEGNKLKRGLRAPLCGLAMLAYHTVVTYVLGTGGGNIQFSDEILHHWLSMYPKGAMFLFFAGRLEEIKGNIREAIVRFEECVDAQSEWKQFHHLCYWELMWCHAFRQDWLLAMKYAEILCNESRWSRATYSYQKACFFMMCDEQTEATKEHINSLMTDVPTFKQRIAGKSIPIEKFTVKKCRRYFEQNGYLTLPSYELMYVWNEFIILGKKVDMIEPILADVENAMLYIQKNKDELKYFTDDYCLLLLLKGVCLRYLKETSRAKECFLEIRSLEKKIKEDLYLVPYSEVELSQIIVEEGNLQEAQMLLEKTKTKYKGYSLESRLHFRIHATNSKIKLLQEQHSPPQQAFRNSPPPTASYVDSPLYMSSDVDTPLPPSSDVDNSLSASSYPDSPPQTNTPGINHYISTGVSSNTRTGVKLTATSSSDSTHL